MSSYTDQSESTRVSAKDFWCLGILYKRTKAQNLFILKAAQVYSFSLFLNYDHTMKKCDDEIMETIN